MDKKTKQFIDELVALFCTSTDLVEGKKKLIEVIAGRSLDAQGIEYLFLLLEFKANQRTYCISTEATATNEDKQALVQQSYEKMEVEYFTASDDIQKYKDAVQGRHDLEVKNYKLSSAKKAGTGNRSKKRYELLKRHYLEWKEGKTSYAGTEQFVIAMIEETNYCRTTLYQNLKAIKNNLVR